tara:strand:- start:13 stop:348 length:336 start_codon:yes stop_codon:yes gene_type:complete
MLKIKIFLLTIIFSVSLGFTSIVKNQTRILEKDISKLEKNISLYSKDLRETELDFFYLTSPKILSKKIKDLSLIDYTPLDFSQIYFNFEEFLSSHNKITNLKDDQKKTKKK